MAQLVRNLPEVLETQVETLGWEDPLEKGVATHTSNPCWEIPRPEEPGRGGLQSMGSQATVHGITATVHGIMATVHEITGYSPWDHGYSPWDHGLQSMGSRATVHGIMATVHGITD